MNKITREEVKCPICGSETYKNKDKDGVVVFCKDLNCPYNSKTYKPQLSDDVEEALLNLREYALESVNEESERLDVEYDFSTIKQKLQSQASEIDRLKPYENMEYHLLNRSDNTVTMPKKQYHKFELELINKTQQLNAIREVVTPTNNNYDDIEFKVYYQEIWKILKEEK